MNEKAFSLMVIGIYAFVMSIILFSSFVTPYTAPTIPYNTKTADLNTLKQVSLYRLNNINNTPSFLKPYNRDTMQLSLDAVKSSTNYAQLATSFLLAPNHGQGTGTILPLKNTTDTLLFQFEQGSLGWYWGYLTFLQPLCNIMFYIIRIDLSTPEIRKKFNLPLGSTTVYAISLGVGHGAGTWQYSPPIITDGNYKADGINNFTFTSSGNWGRIIFTSNMMNGKQNFDLNFTVNSSFNKQQPFSAICSLQQGSNPPALNNPGGCTPCAAGAGTLYWSYPDLLASINTMTINNNVIVSNITDGYGWMDRQWLSADVKSPLAIKLLSTVVGSGGGLGRYMWITIHVDNPRAQYMVTAYPDPSLKIQANTEFPAPYLIYVDGKTLVKKGSVKILETTVLKNTVYGTAVFPTRIQVSIKDINNNPQQFILDSAPYGDCVTIDLTGNLHWAGATSLSVPGSGFMELNQFQNKDDYLATTMSLANIPKSKISTFQTKASTGQKLPSWIIIGLTVILILASVILAILSIV